MTFVESKIEMRPVGQGAFFRGEVRIRSLWHDRANVRWIYDCGTEASKSIIDASVHDLSDTWPRPEDERAKLDVLILSHFDKDHISGIPTLLKSYTFDRIFMPHIPRLKRLVAVLQTLSDESADRSAELIELADDPVGFIRARGGDASNLIFVLPAGDEPPSEDEDSENTFIPLSEDQQRDVTRGRPAISSTTGSIRLIRSGRRVVFDGAWELIPYVDSDAQATLAFDSTDHADLEATLNGVKEAAAAVAAVKASAKKAEGVVPSVQARLEATIKGLKAQVYEKMRKVKAAGKSDKGAKTSSKRAQAAQSDVGKLTAKEKNAISLMVYMGAIYPRASLIRTQEAAEILSSKSPLVDRSGESANGNGILLTGDANLKEASAVDALVRHLKLHRTRSLSVFQVPHHGSIHNSDLYTAQVIGAPYNVFNANPFGKHKHPSQSVIGHFSSHTPAHTLSSPPFAILANARPFIAAVVSVDKDSASHHFMEWLYNDPSNWSLT